VPTAVLCYHSNNVTGSDYCSNDHVALKADLEAFARHRIPVRRLSDAVKELDAGPSEPGVALSFDDGSWFDWHDLEHPSLGMQRSFANVIGDAETAYRYRLPATSFVIVSPQAREQLDRTCLIGKGWWGDDWWGAAIASARLDIESHSWDHQHETLDSNATGLPGGTFKNIESYDAADIEIRRASDFLDERLPRKTSLFAYPYGEYSDYLSGEYLPGFVHEHRLMAAFTTQPQPLVVGSPRWTLGRFVCGQHWRSPDELRALLKETVGIHY
jgi:hypothetical protein